MGGMKGMAGVITHYDRPFSRELCVSSLFSQLHFTSNQGVDLLLFDKLDAAGSIPADCRRASCISPVSHPHRPAT